MGMLPLLVWLAAMLCLDVTRPWTGQWDWNGAVWSEAARHNLRAGLWVTLGVPNVAYYGGAYLHHPPLFSLTVTGVFALFGEKEWAARLVPIGCSLVSALLLWAFAYRCVGARVATLSLAIFVLLPMQLYYGRMVNHEPAALPLMLAVLVCLHFADEKDGARWLIGALGCFALAMWTTWHAYILAVIVGSSLVRGPHRSLTRAGWAVLATAGASATLFLVYARLVSVNAWDDLWQAFAFRLGPHKGEPMSDFTWLQWFARQRQFLGGDLSPLAWALGVVGAFWAMGRRASGPGWRWLTWAALSFFLMAVTYVVGWRQASYIHEYAGFYFTVPVAFMGGVALDELWRWNGGAGQRTGWRLAGAGTALAILALLGALGYARTRALHAMQYHVLDWSVSEPANLIPALGRLIRRTFPEDTVVICNFPVQGPQLGYYADRSLIYDENTYRDWEPLISGRREGVGGVIWLGAPGAEMLVAELSPGTSRSVRIDGQPFRLWSPIEGRGPGPIEATRPSVTFGVPPTK
jgi:Dolichyl-phosphate-mannose-protein mannosyltransferase